MANLPISAETKIKMKRRFFEATKLLFKISCKFNFIYSGNLKDTAHGI